MRLRDSRPAPRERHARVRAEIQHQFVDFHKGRGRARARRRAPQRHQRRVRPGLHHGDVKAKGMSWKWTRPSPSSAESLIICAGFDAHETIRCGSRWWVRSSPRRTSGRGRARSCPCGESRELPRPHHLAARGRLRHEAEDGRAGGRWRNLKALASDWAASSPASASERSFSLENAENGLMSSPPPPPRSPTSSPCRPSAPPSPRRRGQGVSAAENALKPDASVAAGCGVATSPPRCERGCQRRRRGARRGCSVPGHGYRADESHRRARRRDRRCPWPSRSSARLGGVARRRGGAAARQAVRLLRLFVWARCLYDSVSSSTAAARRHPRARRLGPRHSPPLLLSAAARRRAELQ